MVIQAKKAAIPAIAALCIACAALMAVLGLAGQAYADDGALHIGAVDLAEDGTESGGSAQHADGWEKDSTGWHYWENGNMLKGAWRTFDKGPSISGAASGSHTYWIDQDGILAQNRVIDLDKDRDSGAKYCAYATKYGYFATGKTVVGNRVYLSNSKGRLALGDDDGFIVTKAYDGTLQRYYISPTVHAAVTGKVVKVPGYGKVYNIPKKGYVLRGAKKIDKTHVLLADNDGKLRQKSGWVVTNKFANDGQRHRYYLEPTSKDENMIGARIGLFKLSGKKYYGTSAGYVLKGAYKKLDGIYYHADGKGVLTKAKVINRMISLAQGYSSPSRYLIMVDTDDTKVIVFQGSRGNWKVKYIWNCVTGAVSTPTIIGTFSIGAKGYSFGESHGYSCYYWSQIYGDYLFHTRKYYPGTHKLQDARMNKRASMGCVRLMDEDAIWIWRNAPSGTTVVTMR